MQISFFPAFQSQHKKRRSQWRINYHLTIPFLIKETVLILEVTYALRYDTTCRTVTTWLSNVHAPNDQTPKPLDHSHGGFCLLITMLVPQIKMPHECHIMYHFTKQKEIGERPNKFLVNPSQRLDSTPRRHPQHLSVSLALSQTYNWGLFFNATVSCQWNSNGRQIHFLAPWTLCPPVPSVNAVNPLWAATNLQRLAVNHVAGQLPISCPTIAPLGAIGRHTNVQLEWDLDWSQISCLQVPM